MRNLALIYYAPSQVIPQFGSWLSKSLAVQQGYQLLYLIPLTWVTEVIVITFQSVRHFTLYQIIVQDINCFPVIFFSSTLERPLRSIMSCHLYKHAALHHSSSRQDRTNHQNGWKQSNLTNLWRWPTGATNCDKTASLYNLVLILNCMDNKNKQK